jgi:hypothetical protein
MNKTAFIDKKAPRAEIGCCAATTRPVASEAEHVTDFSQGLPSRFEPLLYLTS